MASVTSRNDNITPCNSTNLLNKQGDTSILERNNFTFFDFSSKEDTVSAHAVWLRWVALNALVATLLSDIFEPRAVSQQQSKSSTTARNIMIFPHFAVKIIGQVFNKIQQIFLVHQNGKWNRLAPACLPALPICLPMPAYACLCLPVCLM